VACCRPSVDTGGPTRSRARSTLLAINVDADCSFPISQVREIDRLQASENQDASGFARSELSQAASFAPACGPNWASAFADVSSVMH